MNYAVVIDGVVKNIIRLHPMNAGSFANAVPTNGLPVTIGDTYAGGRFYRNGEEVTHAKRDADMEEIIRILTEGVDA